MNKWLLLFVQITLMCAAAWSANRGRMGDVVILMAVFAVVTIAVWSKK